MSSAINHLPAAIDPLPQCTVVQSNGSTCSTGQREALYISQGTENWSLQGEAPDPHDNPQV